MVKNKLQRPVPDLNRVKAGDMVVLPAETGKPRIHLTPGGLSKYGVSVGHTIRSSNDPDTLKRLVTDTAGKTTAFVVASVRTTVSARLDKTRLLVRLTTDSPNEDDIVPVIRTAVLLPVPLFDWRNDPEIAERFATRWPSSVPGFASTLDEFIGDDRVAGNAPSYAGHEPISPDMNPQAMMSVVFDRSRLKDVYRDREDVPTLNGTRGGHGQGGALFAASFHGGPLDASYDKDRAIVVTPKLLGMWRSRGAVITRPDADAMKRLSAIAARVLAGRVAGRFGRRMSAARVAVAKLAEAMKVERGYEKAVHRLVKRMDRITSSLDDAFYRKG